MKAATKAETKEEPMKKGGEDAEECSRRRYNEMMESIKSDYNSYLEHRALFEDGIDRIEKLLEKAKLTGIQEDIDFYQDHVDRNKARIEEMDKIKEEYYHDK